MNSKSDSRIELQIERRQFDAESVLRLPGEVLA